MIRVRHENPALRQGKDRYHLPAHDHGSTRSIGAFERMLEQSSCQWRKRSKVILHRQKQHGIIAWLYGKLRQDDFGQLESDNSENGRIAVIKKRVPYPHRGLARPLQPCPQSHSVFRYRSSVPFTSALARLLYASRSQTG